MIVTDKSIEISKGLWKNEGWVDDDDAADLPTAGMATGSNYIGVPSGDVYVYGKTGWGKMLNISVNLGE